MVPSDKKSFFGYFFIAHSLGYAFDDFIFLFCDTGRGVGIFFAGMHSFRGVYRRFVRQIQSGHLQRLLRLVRCPDNLVSRIQLLFTAAIIAIAMMVSRMKIQEQ